MHRHLVQLETITKTSLRTILPGAVLYFYMPTLSIHNFICQRCMRTCHPSKAHITLLPLLCCAGIRTTGFRGALDLLGDSFGV